MHYVHYVHQSLARTLCWYVPGRAVRMSSAILGQMEDILIISRCVIAALDILNTWQMPVDTLSASIISLSP